MATVETPPKKLIIRTSDRGMFLRCRLQWHLASKIRLNLEPLRNHFYYDFGTAHHAALAVWYMPERWDKRAAPSNPNLEWAKEAFVHSLTEQRQQYRERGIDSLELDEEFDAALELGPKMLDNYAKWSLANDDFTPIMVEKEFEVQIGWFHEGTFMSMEHITPCPACIPIVYQGRIDGLVEDFLGNYWILEHKSGDKAPGNTRWLAMDPQSGSYIWALQKMLKLKIKGVIHTTTIKKAPHPPKINKNGEISVDKSQLTNADLFKETLNAIKKERELKASEVDKYHEYMAFLIGPDRPQFIYREMVARNANQIDNIGTWIEADAREMLGDPEIKPSPSMMNCNGCKYYPLSLAWQEGSDWKFIADTEFVNRVG